MAKPKISQKTPKAKKLPYRIVNEAESDAAIIWIYSYIGDDSYWDEVNPEDFQSKLSELDGKDVCVRIHSRGGSVPAGFIIMESLAEYSGEVSFKIDGWALSMAAILPLIPKAKVSMSKTGRYMLHGPSLGAYGTEEDLRDSADLASGYKHQIAEALSEKTGRDVTEFVSLLSERKDHWYTAEEALEAGYIDEITESEQVTACCSVSDIKLFGEVPDEVKEEIESEPDVKAEVEPEPEVQTEPESEVEPEPEQITALEVIKICNKFGHPEMSEQFIENEFTEKQIKATLTMLKAAGDGITPPEFTPEPISPTASWAKAFSKVGIKLRK
jgi:ATP-dependent protease ClpP protease subunit